MERVMLQYYLNASMRKSTMIRYVDMARVCRELAVARGNIPMSNIFMQELDGYDGDVPKYRKVGGADVRISLLEIMHRFDVNNSNDKACTNIDGCLFRLSTLKKMLNDFENFAWAFMGGIMRELSVSGLPQLPEISLEGLPPELAEKIAEMM